MLGIAMTGKVTAHPLDWSHTGGSTNRSIMVEEYRRYQIFPSMVTVLTELQLHKDEDIFRNKKPLTYFELGVGEGNEILQLKSLFPCVRMLGMNAKWACGSPGVTCSDRYEDIISTAEHFHVRGIGSRNCPHVFLGDADLYGLPFLKTGSVDFITSNNAFHYIRRTMESKYLVLKELLRALTPTGLISMRWTWPLALQTYQDICSQFNRSEHRKDEQECDKIIIRGISGHYGGQTIRACLLVSGHNLADLQLFLARGDTFTDDPQKGTYLNVPEDHFNVPLNPGLLRALYASFPRNPTYVSIDGILKFLDELR
jgi:SAM-dependent methyltransferase